jgi:hypothetical protein
MSRGPRVLTRNEAALEVVDANLEPTFVAGHMDDWLAVY